jgi:hypothetical protein
MRAVHIAEDADEKRDGEPNWVRETWYTPEEALGELVEFEKPGTMGKEVYKIVEVNPDKRVTIVENLRDGHRSKIDDSFLPPNWDSFSKPRLGSEHTVYWREHLDGDNNWVKTTPKLESKSRAQTYYGHYVGHEKTRIVERTNKYIPPGIVEIDIREHEGEPTIFKEDTPEKLDQVFDQIVDDLGTTFEVLGHIYVDGDYNIVSFTIESDYRVDNYCSPFDILENPLI